LTHYNRIITQCGLLAVLIWCGMPGFLSAESLSNSQLLAKANNLVKQNRAQEAYDLLMPMEASKAGDPAFDYMLGVSAMESGDLSNAVFALQRAIAMKPDFVGAKMDLARTYYKLDELREARQEFNSILSHKPSRKLTEIVNLYLYNIKRKQSKPNQKNAPRISLSMGAGIDSNANSAPEIERFLGLELPENNREKPSSYVGTGAKISHAIKLSATEMLSMNAGTNQRSNNHASFVNNSSFSAGSGYTKKTKEGQFLFNGLIYQAYLAGRYSGRNLAGVGMFTLPEKKGQSLGFMTNVSMFRANAAGSARDANQYVFGVNINSKLKKSLFPSSVYSFSAGKSIPVESTSTAGKQFGNFRILLTKNVKLRYPTMNKASIAFVSTRYDTNIAGTDRRDRSISFDLSSDVVLSRKFKLSFAAKRQLNHSSVDIYKYTKNDVKATIHWTVK